MSLVESESSNVRSSSDPNSDPAAHSPNAAVLASNADSASAPPHGLAEPAHGLEPPTPEAPVGTRAAPPDADESPDASAAISPELDLPPDAHANQGSDQALIDAISNILGLPSEPTAAPPSETELSIPIEVVSPSAPDFGLPLEGSSPNPISVMPAISVARTISIGAGPAAPEPAAPLGGIEPPTQSNSDSTAAAATGFASDSTVATAAPALSPIAEAPLGALTDALAPNASHSPATPHVELPVAAPSATAPVLAPVVEAPVAAAPVFAPSAAPADVSPALAAVPVADPLADLPIATPAAVAVPLAAAAVESPASLGESPPAWNAQPQQPIFADSHPSSNIDQPTQGLPAPEALDAAAQRLAGSFEKYQRLFAESERPGASENAILAALDAAASQPPAAEPLARPVVPAPAAEPPSNLDLEKDVDWGEPPKNATALLGRVAAAIPLAEIQAAPSPAVKESSRPKPASSGAAFANLAVEPALPMRVRSRADSRLDDDAAADSSGPYSASQRKSRRPRGRSRSDSSSTLLIFSFVASVVLALGTGFVAGFVVGRGSPSTTEETRAEANNTQTKPQRSDSSAAEGDDEVEIVKEPEQTAAVTRPARALSGSAAQAANKPQRTGFDQKSAGAALSKAQSRAGLCVQPGEPGGTAVVTVTFDPSGSASDAAIYSTRFAGTTAAECMVKMLRELKVRPFTGEPVTVKKKISVE